MPYSAIERLLAHRIGFSPHAVSGGARKAVAQRMAACGTGTHQDYLQYLRVYPEEWDELIESVVVTETWFFRNSASFEFLKQYVISEWRPAHASGILRILSLPCATGEEPYSIAMTLAEAGLSRSAFRIDAVDISAGALMRSARGRYGHEAFRGEDRSFRERYFRPEKGGYRILKEFKKNIRFIRGNLMDRGLLTGEPPYDIVFCRNLMIYLNPLARKQAITSLRRLTGPAGLLFVGHAEYDPFREAGFVRASPPRAFALRPVQEKSPGQRRLSGPRLRERIHRICKAGSCFIPDRPVLFPTPEEPDAQKVSVLPSPHPARETEDILAQARGLADKGRLDTALKHCRTCLCKDPAHIHAHFLAGMICQALGDDMNAEIYLDKTVYLDPEHHEALEQLALIAEHRGDHSRAGHLRRRSLRVRQREPRT